MSYQKVKCPKGHTFMATVYSKHQKIECPECKRRKEDDDTGTTWSPGATQEASFSWTDTSSSSSDSGYTSGGGGDFGGGGASGDW